MTKLCRYCNAPMAEEILTDYSNPIREGHPPIPVYKCHNPKCEHQPYFFRYEKINPPDEKYGSFETVTLGKYGKVVREWFCPFCDNPLEILSSCPYYIWNCPNCYSLNSQGMTTRYYPIIEEKDGLIFYDTDKEIVEERRCGTCWAPELPPESDEEDD